MDDVYRTDILSRYQVPRHRLTVRDYHRLIEAGVLRKKDRVELLEGQLVDMASIGPRHALAVDALNEDMTVRSSRARLWPQTERLKAALRLYETSGDDEYLAHALAAAEALWRYLDVPTRGLWHDTLTPTNRFIEEPAPASSLYHIIGAVAALMRFRAAQIPGVSIAAQ